VYLVYGWMCLIFGTTFLAIKVGIEGGVPPFLFAGTRFLAAGGLLLLFLKLTGTKIALTQQQRWDAGFVGTTMTALLFGCLYWGEQHISSSAAALLSATAPLMIMLIEFFRGQRGAVMLKISGLLTALLGVGIALYPAVAAKDSWLAMAAVAFILASEVAYAFGAIRSRLALVAGVDPFVLNGWQMLVGGIWLLALSWSTESWQVTGSRSIVVTWLYLVVFGSLIGHGAYYWLVRTAGPLLPSTWTYVSPIIAQLVGFWFLAESLTIWSLVGLCFVLVGVGAVSRASQLAQWLSKRRKTALSA
jgi:drug/metabolite transporter (DMT)-like permease